LKLKINITHEHLQLIA